MSPWVGTWAVALFVAFGAGGQQQPFRHHHQRHHPQIERVPTLRDHSPSPYIQGSTVCPNCLLGEEKENLARLEAIKRQILSKLGLSEKPNVTSALPRDIVLETLGRAQGEPPPSTTTQGFLQDAQHTDDFFATTSEIIAFAEPGSTLNGQTLLEFPHPGGGERPELRVKQATLWVHVAPRFAAHISHDRNLTLWVFRVRAHIANATRLSGKEFDTYTEMSSSVGVRLSSLGWQKLDITRTVGSWYNSGRRERLRLLVDCSGCGKEASPALVEGRSGEKVRPFLVAHTEPSAGRRVRRLALDCSTATKGQCCKETFYVSFEMLGWDDWVIAPKGYNANYCRGDCSRHRTPDSYYHYHGHVIDQIHKVDRLAGLQPCCVPMKFSSTSIIYFGKDNNILKKDLPRMVVDECGCP